MATELKTLLESAKCLAASDARCVRHGLCPVHAAACVESPNQRRREQLDRDDLARSHLTTAVIAPHDPYSKDRALTTGRAAYSAPAEVNFNGAATTNHVAAAWRRMIGMVRWHRAARRR